MTKLTPFIPDSHIIDLIHNIRGQQVMIDTDLAQVFQVETKYLNRAVKRNEERFPEFFRFQLTIEEYDNLRFQIGTSNKNTESLRSQSATPKNNSNNLKSQTVTPKQQWGRRYLPSVFTKQEVSLLSFGIIKKLEETI